MGANQSIRAGHIRAASSSSLHPPVSRARGRAARARSGSYANMRCQLIRFSPFLPVLVSPSRPDTHFLCSLSLSLARSLCLRTYKVPRVNQLELFSFPISYADCGRAASAATRVAAAAACTYVCLFGQGTTRASAQETKRPSEWGGSTWLKLRTNKRREREEEDAASPLALSKRKEKETKQRGPGCQAPVCWRVRLLVRISRNLQPRLICHRLLARMAEARADGRVTALRRPSREIVYTHYNRRTKG